MLVLIVIGEGESRQDIGVISSAIGLFLRNLVEWNLEKKGGNLRMTQINPMYNLINTMIDDREIVIFLGAGASMEGTRNGAEFPGFDAFIDEILQRFGFDPARKKDRFNNFLSVIKKWESEKRLAARLREFLEGEPGLAHHYLAALSIALAGESNALLYLTANYDDLMKKAFTDLERNPIKRFDTIVLSIRPQMTGREFQEMTGNLNEHLRDGRPVILKLFGDLNSQSPIFKTDDMRFEPGVEEQLIEWMKKPMIFIGYSFSDKIIEELLIASRGSSPIFLIDPSGKKIPTSIKNLDRVYHIKKSFSEFILDAMEMVKEKKPAIIEKMEKILGILGSLLTPTGLSPVEEAFKTVDSSRIDSRIGKIGEKESFSRSPKNRAQKSEIKKILILSANPKTTRKLRLDEEIREIKEGLQRAKYRSKFEMEAILATRHRDLRRALLDYEPHIIHFSGHGKRNGLFLENETGIPMLISTKSLAGLFELCTSHVECVILNSCYSAPQAQAIGKHIDYVIGMRREIEDKAAIEFSVAFYDALGAGRPVEDAFKFGCNAIQQVFPDTPEDLIPVLKKKNVG